MDETPATEAHHVDIPWPDEDDARLRISVGGCRIRLRTASTEPGSPDVWVSGSYTDPTRTLPLQVTGEHGSFKVSQSARFSEIRRQSRAAAPTLDLTLGSQRPFSLALDTGASEVEADLGGAQLTRLGLRLGAGNAVLSFDRPSATAMQRLDVEAGAASVVMRGIGHASPERMVVAGGAASYEIDFDGPLSRDINARVTTAGAAVTLRVPVETPTRIGVVSVLAGLTVRDGFRTWDDSFWTPAGQDGERPLLSVDSSVTLGSLEIVADGADPAEVGAADEPTGQLPE